LRAELEVDTEDVTARLAMALGLNATADVARRAPKATVNFIVGFDDDGDEWKRGNKMSEEWKDERGACATCPSAAVSGLNARQTDQTDESGRRYMLALVKLSVHRQTRLVGSD
jgi:hypothetical protein